jgi:hypothetical protein
MAWHLCHALGGVGKPSMSKGFIMFQITMEKLLNVEQFFSLKIHLNQN